MEPVLTLLPTQFPVCFCGHQRYRHDEDRKDHCTGKCTIELCTCERFTAVIHKEEVEER